MDEAETLCDRIGIILQGKIRCLGSQYKLKNDYGKGFKLCINLTPNNVDKEDENNEKIIEENLDDNDRKVGFVFDHDKIIKEIEKSENRIKKVEKFLKKIFEKDCTLMEKHRSAVIFEIGSNVFNPEILFKKLEQSKKELEISNWAISQVDLEDIFIKLTEKSL